MDKFSKPMMLQAKQEELKANIADLNLKKQELMKLMADIRRSIDQTKGQDKDAQTYLGECKQILEESSSYYDSIQAELSIFNQQLQECKKENKLPTHSC